MRLTFTPPLDPGAYPFRHRIRVRFAETDAMGIVHHSRYLPYLEETRVEYLRHLGHPYTENQAAGIDFAVLEAYVQYRSALRFDDEIDVHLAVGRVRRATFEIGYLLTVDGGVRATAVTVHGAVDRQGRAARMPSWLRELSSAERPVASGPSAANTVTG